MKSNWDVLKEKVINDDKDGIAEWIRGLRRYPYTPVLDYLELNSDEFWFHEIVAKWEENGV